MFQPSPRRLCRLLVPIKPGWNGLADLPKHRTEVVRQRARVEVGLDRDHAAADVNADRGRDDRRLGWDHRTNGGTHAPVGVRHQGDRAGHRVTAGRPQRLPHGVFFKIGGPGADALPVSIVPSFDHVRGSFLSPSTVYPGVHIVIALTRAVD